MTLFDRIKAKTGRWLYHRINRTSVKMNRYFHGSGVEIGALHNPLDLSGCAITKVSYVDRMPAAQLRQQYPELVSFDLVNVDIVDDGGQLATIPNNSLDFIIANNLIEHLSNPIQALKNWYDRLRPNGIIYLAVPDKRYTFDKDRALTTLQHLEEDFKLTDSERTGRDLAHYFETAELIEKRTGKDAEDRVADLIATHYSIHYHTWDYHSFLAFIDPIQYNMGIPYRLLDSFYFPGKMEFTVILGKQVTFKKSLWGSKQLDLKQD